MPRPLARLLVAVLLTIRLVAPASAQVEANVLRVHFIDVGQGDSILIQSPDGLNALIDGGSNNSLAWNYLQQAGISRLDVVIASHPHEDHIGGLPQILRNVDVGEVWTSGAVHSTGTFEDFIDAITERQIPYHEAKTNDTISLGSLTFDVLYGEPQNDNLNDTSLVLHLIYGQTSFLFTGDAEADIEKQIIQSVDPGRLLSTVLKVGHHGSSTSSSPAFLALVQPIVAIYSAGKNNPYGHPHRETLTALANVGAQVFGTDQYGSIIVETDGAEVSVIISGSATFVYSATGDVTRTTELEAATPPAPLAATPATRYDPSGADRDCGDFTTHDEAQAFFVAAGGPQYDPHRLDGDDDGIACESLP